MVTDTVSLLDMKMDKQYLTLIDSSKVINVTPLLEAYNDLRRNIFQEKGTDQENLRKLDSLRNYYQLEYAYADNGDAGVNAVASYHLNRQLNDHYYYELLYNISPEHPELERVFYDLNLDLSFPPGNHIKLDYIKKQIDSIDYKALDSPSFTDTYRHNLVRGIFQHLSFEKDKKAGKHQAARDWLRTTTFYKKYPEEIDRKTAVLDKAEFKKLLRNLDIVDVYDKKTTLKKLLLQNPNSYYMLDFWATWCQPCISNMKLLEEADLPSKLTILNLSVDYEKDLPAWKAMDSTLMKGKINYRLINESEANTAFTDFVKMERIPRYVMFDKNLNLMHISFYAPYEPQFKDAMESIHLWKYW
ncbi:MAG: thioredoxin-like domain-containing protein [Nonlabens sp.]